MSATTNLKHEERAKVEPPKKEDIKSGSQTSRGDRVSGSAHNAYNVGSRRLIGIP